MKKHSHGRFVLSPKAKKELKEDAKEFLEKNVDLKMTIEGTKDMKGIKVQEKSLLEFKKSLLPLLITFATWSLEHISYPNCETCGTK